MRRTIIIAAAIALAGCGEGQTTAVNQCLRIELFQACMASLPAGPVSTQYSDWDEVVDSCESAAYYQARRITATVPLECRL